MTASSDAPNATDTGDVAAPVPAPAPTGITTWSDSDSDDRPVLEEARQSDAREGMAPGEEGQPAGEEEPREPMELDAPDRRGLVVPPGRQALLRDLRYLDDL